MKGKKRTNYLYASLVMTVLVFCTLILGCTTVEDTTEVQPQDEVATRQEPTPDLTGMPQSPQDRGMVTEPDFASAAAALGVTEDALSEALGGGSEGMRMDFEEAAAKLGVTVEALQTALGTPSEGPMQQNKERSQDREIPPEWS
ncbi:MAG: hypothetical protein Q7J09_00685 [Methanocalculus sp.]|uniref:hypothetical protein n=1 Tax=Methanocalculus sp. TaxID=2004547 RepID=UPI00271A0166|nr:hypothetical protein [Methanocalculus sp.]MDO9538511.1 hypothetical protein [Methanocalculus sp.]